MKDPNQIRLLVAFRTSTRSDHRLTFSGLWGFFEPRVGGQSINCSRSPCAANTPVNQVSSFLPWKVPEGSSAWKHSELTWEDGQPTLLKKTDGLLQTLRVTAGPWRSLVSMQCSMVCIHTALFFPVLNRSSASELRKHSKLKNNSFTKRLPQAWQQEKQMLVYMSSVCGGSTHPCRRISL